MQTITKQDYIYKTEPFDHQRKIFLESRDKLAFGYLAEQGTGKTKMSIDNAAWLFAKGEINTLIIIAPNGVHRNWIDDEIPDHLPDWVDRRTLFWEGGKAGSKKYQKEIEKLFDKGDFLRIIAFNIESFNTVKVKKLLSRLALLECMCVVDESTRIKTPGAKRTRAIVTYSKKMKYKRICNGTPITQSPLDLYSQFRFLNPRIIGAVSFLSFKHEYATWEKKLNRKTKREYEELVEFKNLDKLKAKIAPYCVRVRKSECLDLPEKIYKRYYVEIDKEQRRIYNDMLANSVAELRTRETPQFESPEKELEFFLQDTDKIRAKNAMVKLLRLQQILSGWHYASEEDKTVVPIVDKNTRLAAFMELISDIEGKVIIFSRFVPDIEMIIESLSEEYGTDSVVAYYGAVEDDDRFIAKRSFQDLNSPVRFFVANPQSAGVGLTLHAAQSVIYYSNSFSLYDRLQSEDRAHRIGQRNNVTYYDLEVAGTIDRYIIESLRAKKDIANEITGDTESWL